MQGTQETWVRSLDQEDPLEKGMTTHSSILVWKIPWTGKPGGLQPIGCQRGRHNSATKTSFLTHSLHRESSEGCASHLHSIPYTSGCGPWNNRPIQPHYNQEKLKSRKGSDLPKVTQHTCGRAQCEADPFCQPWMFCSHSAPQKPTQPTHNPPPD